MWELDERIVEFCERNDIFFDVDLYRGMVKFAKYYSDGTYEKVEARLSDCNEHPDGIRLYLMMEFVRE